MGLLRAILDAVLGQADQVAGRAVTRLSEPLTAAETGSAFVESAIGFGEFTDGTLDAKLLVNGEIITATGRIGSPGEFTGLTRGVDGTTAKDHLVGTVVVDFSGNRSALDHVRRGLFVDTAIGEDLNVIGRNLGLHRCPSIDETTWRRIIKAVAYLPKQTIDAFDRTLEALRGDTTSYEIVEKLITDPYKIFVRIEQELAANDPAGVRGRFVLTGGIETVTTGLTEVTVGFPLRTVSGVWLDTIAHRRGSRAGTNFYSGGGTYVTGDTAITLGSSPGAVGTAVIVDATGYGADVALSYHYLGSGFGAESVNIDHYYPAQAADIRTIVRDEGGDRFAYLSDPLRAARCLLNQIRPAGTVVVVETKL